MLPHVIYKEAKAYDICEFNDHFNQIRDLVPKVVEALEHIRFHTWIGHFAREIGTISIEFIFTLCVLFDFYLLLCKYNILMSNIAERCMLCLMLKENFHCRSI